MPNVIIHGSTGPNCPCCDVPCITGVMSCETRGGLAELCGHSEYTAASSPPKKYRTLTLTGSLSWCYYFAVGGTCGPTSAGGFTITYDGTCVYNSSTCAFTDGSIHHILGLNASCSPDGTDTLTTGCGITGVPGSPGPELDEVLTPTEWTLTGNGHCDNTLIRKASGSASARLTNEDTESNAIDRLLAVSPWAGSAGCGASWEERTSGFSFHYLEGKWTVTASGLTPGKRYSTNIEFWRRTYGSGSYALYITDSVAETADGAGNIAFTGDVPNERGFETYATVSACP